MDIAISKHLGSGGNVFFLTLTIQHTRVEGGAGQLEAQLDRLADALSSVKASRAWKDTMKAAGSVGSIRALEPTYGEINGWHPHTHEIVFAARGAMPMLSRLRKIWARALIARDLAGLGLVRSPIERRAKLRYLLTRCLTVQPGSYAAEYTAKYGREPEAGWSLSSEMTGSHMKTTRRAGHCNPWGLLIDYLEGDRRSGELWREYAIAFHGRRQLFWSKGLKRHFGLDEVSDEDFAAAPDKQCTQFVATVAEDDWRLVLRYNARFELLRAAAIDGPLGVEAYLSDLRDAARSGSPPKYGGFFTSEPREVFPLAA
jgi:hypothetical protein